MKKMYVSGVMALRTDLGDDYRGGSDGPEVL